MDSFDGAAGAAPAGWKGLRGRWVLTEDPSAARGPSVLLQDAEADPWAVLLRDGSYAGDLRVSVRFRPVSGREDASGGIALRAQDPRNYLLVRANALEGNLRLYRITDDRREMLASAETAPPALGAWHTLEVVLRRGTATCLLDGRPLLAHPVGDAWPAGRVGLWTKADSRTAFDDFTVLRLKEPR